MPQLFPSPTPPISSSSYDTPKQALRHIKCSAVVCDTFSTHNSFNKYMPVPLHTQRTDVSEALEDQSTQHPTCQPVSQRVTGSASHTATCHSSPQAYSFVFEPGRKYYEPPTTRKKRKMKDVASSLTDGGSRQSVRDRRSQARSTMKADETISQGRTRSIHVTANSVEPSGVGPRSESRLSVDHHGRPFCPFLKDINVSMDGNPISPLSSSRSLPATPVNDPVAIERMIPQDLAHRTTINQGTSDPSDSANMDSTFLAHPFSPTMRGVNIYPPGHAPFTNFQSQGRIVGPFIPATAGDDAATYCRGSSDMQGAPQGNRIFNGQLEPPSSVPDLVALELCDCGIVFDAQSRGALGRLWQPLVDIQCNQWHFNSPMVSAQVSFLDHYGSFNVEAPSTAYPGFPSR